MQRIHDEMQAVRARLARLESAHRRWRTGAVVSLALLGAVVLCGAALIRDAIRAERFVLTGKGDQGRAELFFNPAGQPCLQLTDRDGRARAVFGLDDKGRASIAFHGASGKRIKSVGETGARNPVTPVTPVTPKGKNNVRVKFVTTLGDIVVEVDAEKAPVTVKNFLRYVDDKFYDDTIFHRVISNFMIQGGGFSSSMDPFPKETRAPIKLESKNGLKNVRGTIAMARTNAPDSATAQFFINVVDNPNLDYPNPDGNGYAVFGKVVSGMDVVDRIRNTATRNQGGPYVNAPIEMVVIKSARREK